MRYTIQKNKAFKERTILIDIPGFLKNYAGVISAFVALTNLYFVSQVFKFNKRMSHSKISISQDFFMDDEFEVFTKDGPVKSKVNEVDKTYLLDQLTNIEPRFGLPGQILRQKESMKVQIVNIKNKGDLPSTNVKVELLFTTFGTVNFYPKDTITTLLPRELFSQHKISIKIPYIGANEEMRFQICKLHGQFRETELHLVKLRANGFTYIKQNILRSLLLREDSKVLLKHYKCLILSNLTTFSEFDLKVLYGLPIDEKEYFDQL